MDMDIIHTDPTISCEMTCRDERWIIFYLRGLPLTPHSHLNFLQRPVIAHGEASGARLGNDNESTPGRDGALTIY